MRWTGVLTLSGESENIYWEKSPWSLVLIDTDIDVHQRMRISLRVGKEPAMWVKCPRAYEYRISRKMKWY